MQRSPKFLIVRVGRAGDLVMITPALDSLLEAFPTAELHLLTAADGERVMRGFDPRLTRTWLYTRRFPRSWLLQPRLARAFAQEGYDRVFIFETKPVYRNWLGGVAPVCHRLPEAAHSIHFSERCLRLVDQAVGTAVRRGPVRLPVTEEGKDRASALLAERGIGPDTVLVGLHPTFSGSGLASFRDRRGQRHRHWPAGHFADLARMLAAEAVVRGMELAIVVDALPGEIGLIAPLLDQAGGAITLLAAPPDFQRYKAVLARLDVLVSPNTGPMHIAAAVGTPVVALFSGWSPENCGPFTDPHRIVTLQADGDEGLAAIAPEIVLEAVWRVLDRQAQ